jgi:hypothetical protein
MPLKTEVLRGVQAEPGAFRIYEKPPDSPLGAEAALVPSHWPFVGSLAANM